MSYTFTLDQIVDKDTVIREVLIGTWLNGIYSIPIDPSELGVGDKLTINGLDWIVVETRGNKHWPVHTAYLVPFSEWEGRNTFFPCEDELVRFFETQ